MANENKFKKLTTAVLVTLVVIAATTWLSSKGYLTLEAAQQSLSYLEQQYDANPALFIGVYVVVYALIVALFIPGLVPLNLLAGAVFGPIIGVITAAFSATLGSLTGFLTSRYVFSDWVDSKFPSKSKSLGSLVQKHGWVTVMLLRITPALPVGLTNLLMGVTKVRLRVFILATFFGVVPWIAFYVIAGTELATIDKASDIVSTEMMLLALALVMLVAGTRMLASKFKFGKDKLD